MTGAGALQTTFLLWQLFPVRLCQKGQCWGGRKDEGRRRDLLPPSARSWLPGPITITPVRPLHPGRGSSFQQQWMNPVCGVPNIHRIHFIASPSETPEPPPQESGSWPHRTLLWVQRPRHLQAGVSSSEVWVLALWVLSSQLLSFNNDLLFPSPLLPSPTSHRGGSFFLQLLLPWYPRLFVLSA